MKKVLILFSILGMSLSSQAQLLKKIQRKVENRVEKSVDDVLNGKDEDNNPQKKADGSMAAGPKTTGNFEVLTTTEPFKAGTILFFDDSLSYDRPGHMAKYWQTNSTGSVVEISGAPGKWLKLADQASYQLDTLLQLPQKFTVEFDLLTRADQAADIRTIDFGFAKTNSTRQYIYGSSKETNVHSQLLFYYQAIQTTSNNNRNNSRIDFPLNNYANAIMHVSMSVDGDRMQIYIDDYKVLDAVVLDPKAPKHFYLSTDNFRNNAAAFLSNFRIHSF